MKLSFHNYCVEHIHNKRVVYAAYFGKSKKLALKHFKKYVVAEHYIGENIVRVYDYGKRQANNIECIIIFKGEQYEEN